MNSPFFAGRNLKVRAVQDAQNIVVQCKNEKTGASIFFVHNNVIILYIMHHC